MPQCDVRSSFFQNGIKNVFLTGVLLSLRFRPLKSSVVASQRASAVDHRDSVGVPTTQTGCSRPSVFFFFVPTDSEVGRTHQWMASFSNRTVICDAGFEITYLKNSFYSYVKQRIIAYFGCILAQKIFKDL